MVKTGKIMIAKLIGTGVTAFVLFVLPASTAAQVTEAHGDYVESCLGNKTTVACRPPNDEKGTDVENRLKAYQPDPVKYPVPRTKDGKPDFNGVYWPDV